MAPRALFRRSRFLWNRDRTNEAQEGFQYFLRRYPQHGNAAESLYALGRMAESSGDTQAAIDSYRRIVRTYPQANVAGEASWRIGWVLYRNQHWLEAADAFASAARRWPSISNDATYWQARSLERGQRLVEARKVYERLLGTGPNYYSYWAESRLGKNNDRLSTASTLVQQAPARIPPLPQNGMDPYHLLRAQELAAMGLSGPGLAELRAFERDSAAQGSMPRFFIEAYRALGGYRDAIRITQRSARPDPYVLHPLAFWPEITTHTRDSSTDPFLILSLMRQESMFDPSARSPADARGLMQLLPSTAVRTARLIGKPPPSADDLYDPDLNITIGIAHFRHLLDQYGGDSIRSLAAYNGGENAVARWDRQFGGTEPDEWVESITYRETRSYVKKVLSNRVKYRQLYVPSATR